MSESEDAPRGDGRGALNDDGAVDESRAALADLPDGSGCTEIWDYLSERRRKD